MSKETIRHCSRCGAEIQGDDPYCDDCYDRLKGRPIHDYSYKPDPIFYGSGKRFFGVELEIDDGGRDRDNAQSLLDIANSVDEKIYIKCDGSLDNGIEIATHPMTLDYHKNGMPWKDIKEEKGRYTCVNHKLDYGRVPRDAEIQHAYRNAGAGEPDLQFSST